MEKYQNILRDQTERNFAEKKMNTSLMMFPLRLETKIMDKDYPVVAEPEKSLHIFSSLADMLKVYLAPEGSEEEALYNIKQAIAKLKTEMEKMEMMYKEDKAILTDLIQNLYDTLHTVELQDAFAPIIDVLKDVTCVTSLSDKASTTFLNDMDKMTRLLVETVNRPDYNGKKRTKQSIYSTQATYLKALRHFRQIYNWACQASEQAKSIPQGMVYSKQVGRFDKLAEQWNALISPDKEKNRGYTELEFLTRCYGMLPMNCNKDSIRYRNTQNAHDALQKFMKEKLYSRMSEFKNGGWKNIRTTLQSKTAPSANQKEFAHRYSVLASKLLSIEILLAKYRYNSDADYRYALLKKIRLRTNKALELAKFTYINYGAEEHILLRIADDINRLSANYLKISNTKIALQFQPIHKGAFNATESKKSLCVRIYPDVVALTQTARQLNRAEYLTGKDFWLKYIFSTNKRETAGTEEYKHSLWLAICDVYPAHRAAFILKHTFPKVNYKVMCRKAQEFHDDNLSLEDFMKEIDENFVNSFPTTYVDNGENVFTVPVTDLLPDRFVLRAEVKVTNGRKATLVRYGHRLPSQLQVGLDLNNIEDSILVQTNAERQQQLYLNGNLRWMTDYSQAEQMGMAISLPLDALKLECSGKTRDAFEFSSIYVYGINDAGTDECSDILQELMTTHLYSGKPMDIISFETVSNILSDEDTEYAFDSSEEKQRERFKHQAYNCVHPHMPEPGNDLDILDRLFCLKESVLGNVDNPKKKGTSEVEMGRRINKLMIEYLTDSTLGTAINPLLKAIKSDKNLFDFVVNDVLPRGPFPMIRISDQPYGILPVCDFRYLNVKRPLDIIKKILVVLTTHWNNILSNNIVNCYGKDGATEGTVTTADYLNILNSTPRSTSFFERKTVKSGIINAEYFRWEDTEHQIAELLSIAKELNVTDKEEDIKSIIPNYDYVPVIDKSETDENGNSVENSVTKLTDELDLKNITDYLVEKIKEENARNAKGLQLNENTEDIKKYAIEFFDLFNYRLDAWLMGMLNNKLRKRMDNGKHGLAIGSFGWIFNLKQDTNAKQSTDEYILAPSVNQAVTAAIMRSSYNNSLKNGDRNYDMSVNLSSERVRSAVRIIEGIQNGLSIASILGTDLERLIHEAYKTPFNGHKNLELDVCIYPLRKKYPLAKSQNENTEDSISVLNGAALLEDYRKVKEKGENYLQNWVLTELNLFSGQNNAEDKCDYLLELIDQIDDEYDALTDVVLSESVYKLVLGNRDASDALSRALDEMKNIPMPDVVNIPITSAQIDNYMLAMLDTNAEYKGSNVLAGAEPKIEAWITQMVGNMDNIYANLVSYDANGKKVYTPVSLGELGISASEFAYLSSDEDAFLKFISILKWLNGSDKYADAQAEAVMMPTDDDHSLTEMQVVADDLRKILSASHALRNDELVKDTGLENLSVTDNMSRVYDNLEGYMNRMLNEMSTILDSQKAFLDSTTANPDYDVLDDDVTEKIIRLLVESYRIGQPTALSEIEPDLIIGSRTAIENVTEWKQIVTKQHSLINKLQSVYDDFSKKLESAKMSVAAVENPDYTVFTSAVETILVNGFKVIPAFQPDTNVPLDSLSSQNENNHFHNIDSFGVETTIGDLAQVEEPMMHFHQMRMFQKCNDLNVPTVLPMQIVSKNSSAEGEYWLGSEFENDDNDTNVADAFTYLVANPERITEAAEMKLPKLAGLVIDHWVERIPYKNQTAAVTFAYDQPDAEAPQTILLAVSTKDNDKGWNEKMLVNSFKSAIHMVKARTVSPDLLCKDAWTSGIFPLLEYKSRGESTK